jgi:uncharacterized protein YodC (DUF2158 family)
VRYVENLQVGDVVQLKSGGPQMTIDEISGDQAHCVWFVGDDQRGNWFGQDALTRDHV